MSKRNTWLVQLVNLFGYLILQLIINQAIVSFDQPCFIYIGFFLFLPWTRSNLIWQLLLAFVVGLLVDAFYDSLGIHTFAAVLIVYLRSFLLYLLLPPGGRHLAPMQPSLSNMGIQKFVLYIFFITVIYHIVVFTLDAYSFHFFFARLPQLLGSIILSNLFIFLSLLLLGAIKSSRSK